MSTQIKYVVVASLAIILATFAGVYVTSYATSTTSRTTPAEIRTIPKPADEKKPSSNPTLEEELKQRLTPEQYHVTREKGTEQAFTGQYWNHKGTGIYECVCCGTALFDSKSKYDSGTGWPSFWEPIDDRAIKTAVDFSLFTNRTEVLCHKCDAHLGHVFEDSPQPTGLRYSINSAALKFHESSSQSRTDD
jgi:peptide-methionine (R)-S-oxide reductase